MVNNQVVDNKKVDNLLVNTVFTNWSTPKIFGLLTGQHFRSRVLPILLAQKMHLPSMYFNETSHNITLDHA